MGGVVTHPSGTANFLSPSDPSGVFIGEEVVTTDTYSPEDESINILYKDGTIKDIAEASDMLNIQVLTKTVEKHFLCYCKI